MGEAFIRESQSMGGHPKERAAKIAPEKQEALIREAIRAEEARLKKADREEFPTSHRTRYFYGNQTTK